MKPSMCAVFFVICFFSTQCMQKCNTKKALKPVSTRPLNPGTANFQLHYQNMLLYLKSEQLRDMMLGAHYIKKTHQ